MHIMGIKKGPLGAFYEHFHILFLVFRYLTGDLTQRPYEYL